MSADDVPSGWPDEVPEGWADQVPAGWADDFDLGFEAFEVPPEWDEGPPPVMAPVPAAHAGALAEEDEVTIGAPGTLWLPDQLVSSPRVQVRPWRGREVECVQVASPASWWAHRAWPDQEWRCQWWPLEHTWVYRDVVDSVGSAGAGSAGAGSATGTAEWLQRVEKRGDRPPTRHPVAARDAGRLTGRRVRVRLNDGSLGWHVAATEPYDDGTGEIVVRLATVSTWAIASLVLADIAPEHLREVEIYRLWVQ